MEATRPVEKKKWQPLNIALGLVVAVLVYFYCRPVYWEVASIIVYARLIPAVVLILTRRNNLFSFLILLILGLTSITFPTIDGFFDLGLAIYMFVSAVLRMFRVKKHMLIGFMVFLIITLFLCLDHLLAFTHEKSLTFTKNADSGVTVELGDSSGQASTVFEYNQMVTPRQRGLDTGKNYAYRVLNEKGDTVIALDNWPVFLTLSNDKIYRFGKITDWFSLGNVASHGTFNSGIWFPLENGDYTIQLVKIEKNVGTVVAEKSFSIAPYSEKILSDITAYFEVEGDPNKYYDTYSKNPAKLEDSVTVYINSAGKAVSGTMRSYMTDSEGREVQDPWFKDSEKQFTTSPDGQPLALSNLKGNPPLGIYHYEITINGKVMFHLKYKV